MDSKVRRVLIAAGTLVGIATVLVLACTRLETRAISFRSYDEAAAAGAVGPDKWLPSWLPRSATDISEAHNIDTNLVWLEFKSATSLETMGVQCSASDPSAARDALPPLGQGFPKSMRESKDQLSKANELTAVRCTDTNADRKWIATRKLGGDVVYAWTVR